MTHYERLIASREPKKQETVAYRCPHCDFSGDLDKVWWHIDQHMLSTRTRRVD